MNAAEKYIYQVYVEKSFSKAAKALFISQPSLSIAVAHKEQELGFPIFDRTTKPISLTAQGQIYIEMLEEILESENTMQTRVQRLLNEKHNVLAVGGSFSSAYYLMPSICGCFHRRYPDVEVTVDIGNVGATSSLSERFTLDQKLDRSELDAVFCYEYDASKYTGYPIYSERLVVAMHRALVPPKLWPYALGREELLEERYDPQKEIRERDLFRDVPFLTFSKGSNLSHRMTELLGHYSEAPYHVTNARHGVVHFNMMCAGVGALLTSDYVIARSHPDPQEIVFFVFQKEASARTIYLITQRAASTNRNLRHFIRVAREIGEEKLPKPV